MNHINPKKVGLTFALVVGGWNLLWSLLVAFGVAQSLVDLMFNLHMVKPVYVVAPFSWAMAIVLILVTGVIGYIVGRVFAMVWNRLHR